MSLFSNLFGGGGPNVGALQKKQSSLIARSNGLADLLMQGYRNDVLSGAYDPNAQLDLLRRDNAYGTRIATGNAAAAARTLGYKPGDTAPMRSIGAIGTRAQLDYDRLAQQIRQNATAAGAQARANAVGGSASIYGQGIGAYGDAIRTALQQEQAGYGLFGNLVGSVMPYLAKPKSYK